MRLPSEELIILLRCLTMDALHRWSCIIRIRSRLYLSRKLRLVAYKQQEHIAQIHERKNTNSLDARFFSFLILCEYGK